MSETHTLPAADTPAAATAVPMPPASAEVTTGLRLAPAPWPIRSLDEILGRDEPVPPPLWTVAGRALMAVPAAVAFWANALWRLNRLHGLIALLFVATYASTFLFMGNRWATDPSAQHGWLVIPIALIASVLHYDRLRRLPVKSHPGGLWVMGLALFLHLFEKAVDLNGPSPLSIPIFVAGAVWHFLGTAFLRELAFPIAYLCFMIPIPGGFTEVVSFPLRLLATNGSKTLAHFFGVEVYGSGMNLEFMQPRGMEYLFLEVADPCSGLHSLMAIKALHAITAYLTKLRLGWKWVLFMCAIPIALAANVTRITLIILIGAYFSKSWAMWFHEHASEVLFVIAFLILIGVGRFMEWATGALKDEASSHKKETTSAPVATAA